MLIVDKRLKPQPNAFPMYSGTVKMTQKSGSSEKSSPARKDKILSISLVAMKNYGPAKPRSHDG